MDGWRDDAAQQSAFGARFDMETDAALILILSVLVWQHDKAGAWVIACGLMRYAFVAAGWVMPWMAGPLRSTLRGKSVAIGQLVGLGDSAVAGRACADQRHRRGHHSGDAGVVVRRWISRG